MEQKQSQNADKKKRKGAPSPSDKPQSTPQTNITMRLLGPESSAIQRNITYLKQPLDPKVKKILIYIGLGFFSTGFFLLCLLIIFVFIPIIFLASTSFQRSVMFSHSGLPHDKNHFKNFELIPELRNLYVSVPDSGSRDSVSLGVWHLLPYVFEQEAITTGTVDFEKALQNSNGSVLLYFHGNGEDRSSSLRKYQIFMLFFHVITFDYRSYADSSENELTEVGVVNDAVHLYQWLTTKTSAPIFVWGHSLGSALAAHTVALLESKPFPKPVGLILESAFTKMSEEIYVHPYEFQIFAWLPWFKATIVQPLEDNGFIFDTRSHIRKIACPIMILCSEDDSIVPYKFGRELYEVAQKRSTLQNTTLYYQFAFSLGYDHYFIYTDPFLPYFINYFIHVSANKGTKQWIDHPKDVMKHE